MGKRKALEAGLKQAKKTKVSVNSAESTTEKSVKKSQASSKSIPKSRSKKTTTKTDEVKVSASQPKKKTYPKEIDETQNIETVDPLKISYTESIPTKNSKGQLVFSDRPELRPNMTPQEVIQAGSFGGTYFRDIKSSVTGKSYTGAWKEFPVNWFEGLKMGKQVSSKTYAEGVNTYGVKCGGSLEMWETSGWIHKQDPYGWFQWYCRFYLGRRSADDERQIGRWLRCAGDTGRWRNNLISKCVRSGCGYDNVTVSPVVRQTLQHWGYQLTKEDFDAGVKKMKQKGLA